MSSTSDTSDTFERTAHSSHTGRSGRPGLGIAGLVTRDHFIPVPLDHARPERGNITVYGREVVLRHRDADNLPWLVFFQGGPGQPALRPTGASGWLGRLLRDYRVFLLDQRGTGRSTPVDAHSLARLGSAKDQAEYLVHFRADSIVRDAELIRKQLVGENRRWTAFGQSYGGWCITSYLSIAPEGLEACLITGGLPPLLRTADEVYRALYPRVEKKNQRFYDRFPEDEARAREIVEHLATHEVHMLQGGRLTPRRFQQAGYGLFRSTGYATLHYLLENAFTQGPRGQTLGLSFLRNLDALVGLEDSAIYVVLHESIYTRGEATRWAAHRVRAEFPQFELDPSRRVLFTGEMMYPWMLDDYEHLRPYKDVAEILAEREGWAPLFDLEVLARNTVPVAALVYYEDMAVDRELSLEAAERIRGTRVWVTNEYEHDGIAVDGERILDRLLEMVRGEVYFAY